MGNFFVSLHLYIVKRKIAFLIIALFLLSLLTYTLVNIKFNEDINSIIPHDARINEIGTVFNSSKLAEKIILNISIKDTNQINDEELVLTGQKLVDLLIEDTSLIENLEFKVNETAFFDSYDFIYNNLPLYLTDDDYAEIEKDLTDSVISEKILKGYKTLISPAGIATKKFFFSDPLNIATFALNKLKNFRIDDNFIIHNSCIFTKDKKHLLIFIDPIYPINNTNENSKLIERISKSINIVNEQHNAVLIEYYGGTVVAVENSKQIKKDILLTVSISLIFLSFLFWIFFKRLKIVFYIIIPVIIGTSVSLAILSILFGEVSIISLGIGAILICISIDYSIHLVTHNLKSGKINETIKSITTPIILSSITTAIALLCIIILKSDALKQLSIFAAIGVIVTSLSVLIILPFLIKKIKYVSHVKTSVFFDRIASINLHKSKVLILIFLGLSVIFPFTIKNIKFNSDISTLNYQSKEIAEAEKNLQNISSEANSGVFVFTHSKSIDEALYKAEKNIDYFKSLKDSNYVLSFSSATDLIMSREAQELKYKKWKDFWTNSKKDFVEKSLINAGSTYDIKNNAFDKFNELLNKDFKHLNISDFSVLMNSFLGNYLYEVNGEHYVVSILKTNNKANLIKKISSKEDLLVFDKLILVNKLMEILNEDFNRLSLLSIVTVFGLILIFFGRIEIAVITFTPIALGWIWTLGLMSIFGIEFNIFNIIISSFIFGLGLDYSIFLVSGLLDNYKYGNISISPYKLSVMLSALTTMGGFGVLIFAQHPALRSIAMVSVIGVLSILLITFTIVPLLFNILFKNKNNVRSEPVKLKNMLISVMSLSVFIFGSFFITLFIPFIFIIPIKKKYKKLFINYLVYYFSNFIVKINFTIKRKNIDKFKLNFAKPSIIISNHQSHLDLVLILMLNPKIIVFTNKWVWNNIFYGFIIRYLDYYPAFKGIGEGFDKIREKLKDGYSILIFPEGKRTINGEINRFHQGAFSIAEELNVEIQPILIHGANFCLPKNEFFLKSGQITMKFYDKITPIKEITSQGDSFKQQAKEITLFYREEYKKMQVLIENPDFFKEILINQYLFKGPVLEWYLRVKISIEKNYNFFNNIIPRNSRIVDIGCGYGFLAHMLKLTSPERQVVGIDYDEEKINIAKNIFKNKIGLEFIHLDITENEIPVSDIYILNDVLHYMPESLQITVLKKCISNLSQNGKIIIRDANADMIKRTKYTKLTEIQSTKIFKMNKVKYKLSFISAEVIKNLANEHGLKIQIIDNAKLTSNIIYILN